MAADLNKNFIRNSISILLAVGVVWLFILYKNEVYTAFRDIRISWVWVGFIFYIMNYLFRASRICILTKSKIPILPSGAYCSSIHGFATYMLPIRIGDLSLPIILNSISSIDIKEGTKILFRARLLDVCVLGSWLLVASFIPDLRLSLSYKLLMSLLGILMVISPIILRKMSKRILIHFKRLSGLSTAIVGYSDINKNEILLSVAIWIASSAMLWCITMSLSLNLSIDEIVFLVAIQLVMQLIPIQGFANSGNHESGWVAAMMMIGYPAKDSFKFALASHAVILLFVFALGFIALFIKFFYIK